MDDYYVLADDALSASVALKDWLEDPSNGMDPGVRLPVHDANLIASQDAGQSPRTGFVNLVFGPMS